MADKPNILVVGSINMDLAIRCPHLPAPGETVLGSGFVSSPGGKGANQAVAVARIGGDCHMIGRVGEDAFGRTILESLSEEGMDCSGISTTVDKPTGVAVIIVDARGENSIVVDCGANRMVNADDDIFSNINLFEAADVVLLQLELPLTLVRAAIDQAERHNCKVILDPAPVPPALPDDILSVDVLTPNIVEAEQLAGQKVGEERIDKNIATDLIARGARAVVAKLGHRGALVVTADGQFNRVSPYKVDIVDTTAAGDAFTAALAVAVARGDDLAKAAKFANAAGALACTARGAISSLPTSRQVRLLMAEQSQL